MPRRIASRGTTNGIGVEPLPQQRDKGTTILRQSKLLAQIFAYDRIYNVRWGLVIENSKYVIHIVHRCCYVCDTHSRKASA